MHLFEFSIFGKICLHNFRNFHFFGKRVKSFLQNIYFLKKMRWSGFLNVEFYEFFPSTVFKTIFLFLNI